MKGSRANLAFYCQNILVITIFTDFYLLWTRASRKDSLLMKQDATTLITRIQPAKIEALSRLLDKYGACINSNNALCLPSLPSLHFACWVMVTQNPDYPPQLMLEANHDGTSENFLAELSRQAQAGLHAIYSHCEGYPLTAETDGLQMTRFLHTQTVSCPAFYIGAPEQSLESIRNAIEVREEIERFLEAEEKAGRLQELDALQVQRRIAQHLETNGAVKPQISPVTLEEQKSRAHTNAIGLILLGIPLALLLLPALLVFYIVLRMHEMQDARATVPPPLPIDPRLFNKEDVFIQNHLTTFVDVKPGIFRKWTLKGVLAIVNLLAKTCFITGSLGGIPTIHFARWILMDDDRRLMFFSNYDGSWASYLGDFVDKANYGLTAIWGNTDRFPPAVNLFDGGAKHIEAFKQWSREHNLYAALWYSAYPNETLLNITNAITVRDAIGKPLSQVEAEILLQRL